MLPVKTIIRRVRARCHDLDNIAYNDEDILDCINMGIRFIRRCIADMRPSLIIKTLEGTVEAGQKSIELTERPLKIVHITVGNYIINSEMKDTSPPMYQNYNQVWHNPTPIYTTQKIDHYRERGLKQTELANVIMEDNDIKGTPTSFYLTGEKTINFFPIPATKSKYTILYVEDLKEIDIEDNSPLLTEYDDFLVEYAAIRLAVGNEYNMSEEQNLMSNIFQQIQKLLLPPPVGLNVRGYFSGGSRRRDGYY